MRFELVVTQGPGDAARLARAAGERGVGRVVVVGGDGTLHEAANGLRGSSAALGVIPLGSGNDFARLLGLRRGRLGAALDAALGPRVERLDLGLARANGTDLDERFLNNCGFALEPEVVRRLAAQRLPLNGLARYGSATVRAFLAYRPRLTKLRVDETRLSVLPLIVQVGNGRFSGGGFCLTPWADLRDGLLDVCLVERMSWPRLLAAVPRAFGGTHLAMKEVSYLRGAEIEVQCDEPVVFHLDGELRTLPPGARSVRLSILPGALRVAVPSEAAL